MLPATVLSRKYAPVGSQIAAALFPGMYTLLRSLQGLNQTGQNRYIEGCSSKIIRSTLSASLSSVRAHAMVNTYRSEKCTIEKKQELASRAFSAKKKRSPQAIAKQLFPSLVSVHHLVSVLQPCPCSCTTVMRDVGLWRWNAVPVGVAVFPQLHRARWVGFVLAIDWCYFRE